MEIKKTKELARMLQGMQTIETIMSTMKVSKQKAIYYIHRLRKAGYVKTKKTSENKRIYYISFENRLKGKSYIDIINECSPIKVASSEDYRIYGKPPSFEETLVYSIKSENLRLITASLPLFKKITNWPELYKLAKANNIKRQIGALYDAARKIIKVRKMTKRFRKNILPKGKEKYKFIINGLKSKNFKDVEKIWRIYVPFNKKDLEAYKK